MLPVRPTAEAADAVLLAAEQAEVEEPLPAVQLAKVETATHLLPAEEALPVAEMEEVILPIDADVLLQAEEDMNKATDDNQPVDLTTHADTQFEIFQL